MRTFFENLFLIGSLASTESFFLYFHAKDSTVSSVAGISVAIAAFIIIPLLPKKRSRQTAA